MERRSLDLGGCSGPHDLALPLLGPVKRNKGSHRKSLERRLAGGGGGESSRGYGEDSPAVSAFYSCGLECARARLTSLPSVGDANGGNPSLGVSPTDYHGTSF